MIHTLYPNIQIFAEVKPISPYGFKSSKSRSQLFDEIEPIGDVISIHTGHQWGGSWEWLKEARKRTKKPILAKGFHPTIGDVYHAFDCGADFVLTVGWWPEGEEKFIQERCIHECESLHELAETPAIKALWNARNPRNGLPRIERIAEARIVRKGWLCQASSIKCPNDVVHGVDAVLIGENLCK